MNKNRTSCAFIGVIFAVVVLIGFSSGDVVLKIQDYTPMTYQVTNWTMASSSNLTYTEGGSQVSLPGFDDGSWYPVEVPCTVMAGLIQNGLYPDWFYGTNLEDVDRPQFNYSWWYRTEFEVASDVPSDRFVILTFKGINYKANLWINGMQLATEDDLIGTFVYFDSIDISSYINATGTNVIAIEVIRPKDYAIPTSDNNSTDLAITWVDWAPYPPDWNMGLWQPVELTVAGPLTIRYPMVNTTLSNDNAFAGLDVVVEIVNWTPNPITANITIEIPELQINIVAPVTVAAQNASDFTFSYTQFSQLFFDVTYDMLWWPWQMGGQTTYNLTVSANNTSPMTASFGIRQSASGLTDEGYRIYFFNNLPILVRGAGWAPDLFQRFSTQRYTDEMTYVRHMNLNAIRLEGKFENDEFFSAADQFGILTMPGICCCDAWQHWSFWGPAQYSISYASALSQGKRLRIHPSILVFLYSSDQLPPEDVEQRYLDAFASISWPNPLLSTASDYVSNITGPSGVKMTGPYSWVAPNYWVEDTVAGGAYGFLTEGGPGQNPLTYESLQLTVPDFDSWPMPFDWNYHCGNQLGRFGNLDNFNLPLDGRYGNATSAMDYLQKSQVAAYESHRAMFEGYSRNKYTSTGVIQWMLNNGWPEMIWHLYDYFLMPGSAYFATKKACQPIHVMYSYDNSSSIFVINSLYTTKYNSVIVDLQILDIQGKTLFAANYTGGPIGPDSSVMIANNSFPEASTITGITMTYFLRLVLYDSNSTKLADNFYWLSLIPDIIDFGDARWYNTPDLHYANLTALQTLPPAEVTTTLDWNESHGTIFGSVNVTNSYPTIAFFIRLRLLNEEGVDFLPILWDDNFFSLVGFESKIVNFQLASSIFYEYGGVPTIYVDVFNNDA